jgi:hypothetical protein
MQRCNALTFSRGRTVIAASALTLCAALGAYPSGALAYSSVTLNESAQLRPARSGNQSVLNEQGMGSGTFSHTAIHLSLTIPSSGDVTYEFSASLPSGSVDGRGRAHFYEQGSTAYFDGTLSITSGKGRYAHASANLSLTGAMNRRSYALALHVSGTLRY